MAQYASRNKSSGAEGVHRIFTLVLYVAIRSINNFAGRTISASSVSPCEAPARDGRALRYLSKNKLSALSISAVQQDRRVRQACNTGGEKECGCSCVCERFKSESGH